MFKRDVTLLDKILTEVQQAVQSFAGPSFTSERTNPAQHIITDELSREEQKHSAALMRVNHAGEISAQGLYRGQALTARSPAVKTAMQQSAAEETDHLAWCRERLNELHTRPSYLDPFWYVGSFCIGAAAGFAGDPWSLGFVIETEQQVERHLKQHLTIISPQDHKSRAIINQMQIDEAYHAEVAAKHGGKTLAKPIRRLMKSVSKIMTHCAYYI